MAAQSSAKTVASRWTDDQLDDQSGRTVLITGANSGLGLHSARVLARKGARVLLACRSAQRGERARAEVAGEASARAPELIQLDLADLASVRAAAAAVRELTMDRLDVLINNAGLMAPPKGTTADGFETQFGTNHLGHAALTWLLVPALCATDSADPTGSAGRVVTVSSLAARGARIDLDDPNFERRPYNPVTAYGQAKLANQVFAIELDRRLRACGSTVTSVAAHPGYSTTGLGSAMALARGNAFVRGTVGTVINLGETLFAQNARMGALPQLYAAAAPGVSGGQYIGPGGIGGLRGHPAVTTPLRPARDPRLGAALWDLTARLTQVRPAPEAGAA